MSKHTTKMVVLGGLLVASMHSHGANGCTAGLGIAVPGSDATFVKDTFTPKCSKAVYLDYVDSATSIGVMAASQKGMHTFGGFSDGGGIFQCESSSVATPEASVGSVTANGCP